MTCNSENCTGCNFFSRKANSIIILLKGLNLLLIQIANKLTNVVSSESEGFRWPKQAQMKNNIVKMFQKLSASTESAGFTSTNQAVLLLKLLFSPLQLQCTSRKRKKNKKLKRNKKTNLFFLSFGSFGSRNISSLQLELYADLGRSYFSQSFNSRWVHNGMVDLGLLLGYYLGYTKY